MGAITASGVALTTAYSAGMSFASGEWQTGITQTVGAVGYGAFAYGQYKAESAAFKSQTVFLDTGIVLTTMVDLLFGGASNKGQGYSIGSKSFELANRTLADAVVDSSSWTGSAADAYGARNSDQMTRTTTMATLDSQIASILAKQARQIKAKKTQLARAKMSLVAAVPVAMSLRLIQPGGEAISVAFELAVFTAAMAVVERALGFMLADASDNRRAVLDVRHQYCAVAAATAQPGGTAPKPSPRAAPALTTTVAGVPEASGVSSTAPDDDAVALANIATGSVGAQAGSASPVTDPQGPANAPGTTRGPAGGSTDAPATVPRLNDWAAQSSGRTATSAQRKAEAAQRPTRPAHADERGRAAERTGADDAKGAAAGARDGERAPIGGATGGAEQEREPNPVQRSL
ncbi:EspA/EspE family type VII secretion system effector [Mycobacterium decipiens]|uniref:ESX-1 secretion-associated protein EspA/EspE-like domain-containing protein n=1 Tax=Mycobacterium decipiens TaxID=1430326 RepID=A0A1X2LTV3_9MYCO|nr:EspA/EspE family type VII secretion system effector [Mycobacterium decipiens]OSC40340.1 hypothetical protein B8W66_13640 [Mycobacterium decipiens]